MSTNLAGIQYDDMKAISAPLVALLSGCGVALSLSLTLVGCGGEAPPAAGAVGAAANAAVSIDVEQTLQRLEPTLLSDLGRSDPFKPLIAIEDPAKTNPAMANAGGPPDPAGTVQGGPDPLVSTSLSTLDDITVSGIIASANSRRSMAILQVGDGATQILQVGQSYTPEDNPETRIQVTGISKTAVHLVAYNKSGTALSKRTAPVQTLIGYKGKDASNKASAGTGQAAGAVAGAAQAVAGQSAPGGNTAAPSQQGQAPAAPPAQAPPAPATN